jgi:hypothetical protein
MVPLDQYATLPPADTELLSGFRLFLVLQFRQTMLTKNLVQFPAYLVG